MINVEQKYKVLGVPADADDAEVMEAYADAWRRAEGNRAAQQVLECAFTDIMQSRGWAFDAGAAESGVAPDTDPPARRAGSRQWLTDLRRSRRERALTEAALHPYTITGRRVSYFLVNLQLCVAAAAAILAAVVFTVQGSTGGAMTAAVLGVWGGSFAVMALVSKMLQSIGGMILGAGAVLLLWRYGSLIPAALRPWIFWTAAGFGAAVMLASVLPAVTVPTRKAVQTRWVLLASVLLTLMAPAMCAG